MSTSEKRQGARIPEGKNTQSHSAIKRNDRPCGNIVERNTVVRYSNRPFAGSGHMVRNKLHWDANDAVGLTKQREAGLDW